MAQETKQFQQTKQLSDVNAAIRIWENLAENTPSTISYYPVILNFIAWGLLTRYTHTEQKKDLERLVQTQEKALSLCSSDSFYRMQCLFNLGTGLKMRYQVHEDLADINRSVDLYEQAIALLTINSRENLRESYVAMLVNALEQRFERTENLDDLECVRQLKKKL